MDRKYFIISWWYRCYEYHACICNRAYKRNRFEKGDRCEKNRILAQFLTEAAVLTSLGGIIGTITGIALAEVIGKISNVPIAISIPAVILAIAFSTIIGVVFGLLPAVKAANLDPIVALRHE